MFFCTDAPWTVGLDYKKTRPVERDAAFSVPDEGKRRSSLPVPMRRCKRPYDRQRPAYQQAIHPGLIVCTGPE
jgi:hypothetical protein